MTARLKNQIGTWSQMPDGNLGVVGVVSAPLRSATQTENPELIEIGETVLFDADPTAEGWVLERVRRLYPSIEDVDHAEKLLKRWTSVGLPTVPGFTSEILAQQTFERARAFERQVLPPPEELLGEQLQVLWLSDWFSLKPNHALASIHRWLYGLGYPLAIDDVCLLREYDEYSSNPEGEAEHFVLNTIDTINRLLEDRCLERVNAGGPLARESNAVLTWLEPDVFQAAVRSGLLRSWD